MQNAQCNGLTPLITLGLFVKCECTSTPKPVARYELKLVRRPPLILNTSGAATETEPSLQSGSHSRKGYSEVVWRQTTESFIRCLENAFRHFGGVTVSVVIDNLKAGVLQADWFDPQLNPKPEEFARHYGTVAKTFKNSAPRGI
jgi:hypothetical protein